jgi:flavodoxin
MNVKIIVYSYTGNTLEVAKKLQEALKMESIPTTLEEIKTKTEKEMDWKKVNLSKAPLPDADCLVFAGPVQAFNLVTIMRSYLNTMPELNKQPCFFLTTEFFPFNWMGGNQAKRTASSIITAKNGKMVDTGIIHWKSKKRDQTIDLLVNNWTQKIKGLS